MESSKAGRRQPMTLHDIVVDYVVNSGFAGTAKVLAAAPVRLPPSSTSATSSATSAAATPPPEDAEDGDNANGADQEHKLATGGLSDLSALSGHGKNRSPTPAQNPALDDAVLASIDQRREILDYVLSGAISKAVAALHTHFPAVLTRQPAVATNGAGSGSLRPTNGAGSNGASSSSTPYVVSPGVARSAPRGEDGNGAPAAPNHSVPVFSRSAEPEHVSLNLQIQDFIELYRDFAASAPPSPSSSIGSMAGSTNGGAPSAELTSTLAALHNLHTDAGRLRPEDRAIYLQEIKDVGGLLAYIEPENSVVSGFLDQQRRIALAQQVNAAILKSEGRPVQSHLEQIVRRTHAVYATLTEHGIDPTPSWTGDAKNATHWRIAEQLKRRPFQKGGFSLREFVWETS